MLRRRYSAPSPGRPAVRIRHAEIEERERMVRPFRQLEEQEWAGHARTSSPAPPDFDQTPNARTVQISPRHLTPEPPDGPQNLLVNPPVEPQLGMVAEELHVIDHGDLRVAIAFLPSTGAMHLHHIRQHRRVVLILDELPQTATALGRNRVVGIHPEQPVTGRVPQRFVASGREIIAPGEVKKLAAERLDDSRCLIDRPGINDDHLVDPRPDALQAGWKSLRIVAHDHAERQFRPVQIQPQPQPAPGATSTANGPAPTRGRAFSTLAPATGRGWPKAG